MTPSWTCADRTARSLTPSRPSRAAAGDIYLTVPCEVRNSAGTLGAGIDVRGDGGYVVAPPSTHASGKAYAWESSSRPDEIEVSAAPKTWLDAMTARPKLRALPGGKGAVPRRPAQRLALQARVLDARERVRSRRDPRGDHGGERRAVRPVARPAEVKAIVESACKHPGLLIRGPREDRGARDSARRGLSPAAPKNETGDWRADLFTTPKGAVRNTFANICAILRNAEEYGERLRYNGC